MEILEKLNIKTNNEKLYVKALTHTSFANENDSDSYERLEYLGDAVLELIISDYLYKKDIFEEGKMTKLRSYYVCEDALYEYSRKIELDKAILFGNGEVANEKNHKAIIADVFESFIGALYLDKGLESVKRFIYSYVIPLIEKKEIDFFRDYKSELQELIQTDKKSLKYIIEKEEGPSHNKKFTVIVKVDGIVYGRGSAGSKKEAERLAAKEAIEKSVK